jgi:arginase
LITLLRALAACDLAVGAEVTIFDPDLDPDGHLAHQLTRMVVEGFAQPDNQQR